MGRIWFDTEFIEDGRTIELLSIGMVRDDGATYYAEPAETDRSRASPWVVENVLPHLNGPTIPREQIRQDILAFAGEKPEFWGYYADYDWVVLCQLFGTMMDLPRGWPMFCRDLNQLVSSLGNARLPANDAHHALEDAMWIRDMWHEMEPRDSASASHIERLQVENDLLRGILRIIAEGNLGDAPWQANYARIKAFAATSLKACDSLAEEGGL